MKYKQFKAVMLDMDGVVLDSMQHHAQCWQEILAEMGYHVDREFVLRHEGDLGGEVLRDLLGPSAGPEEITRAREAMPGLLARQADMYLRLHQPQVSTFPHVREVLDGLAARGLPTALVTSSHHSVVGNSLPQTILKSFKVVITAGDVARHKPHPEPYEKAAKALGVSPRDCLVVENAPAGIAAARAAGSTCFAVTTTLGPAHLGQANGVFGSLLEIGTFLGLFE